MRAVRRSMLCLLVVALPFVASAQQPRPATDRVAEFGSAGWTSAP
jgi:hypothetical protein